MQNDPNVHGYGSLFDERHKQAQWIAIKKEKNLAWAIMNAGSNVTIEGEGNYQFKWKFVVMK